MAKTKGDVVGGLPVLRNVRFKKIEDLRPPHIPEEYCRKGNASEDRFADNCVFTSKYPPYLFVPFFLFESFRKIGYAYFGFVSVMQMVPFWTNTGGLPMTAGPLMVVLFVEGLFAYLEEHRRRMRDKVVNNLPCKVFDPLTKTCKEKKWSEVNVGDLLKIDNYEVVPADVVIMGASSGKDCYVETKTLDGETNLKMRTPLQELQNYWPTNLEDYDIAKFYDTVEKAKLHIECEDPNDVRSNKSIDLFTGKMFFDNDEAVNLANRGKKQADFESEVLLTNKNLLLRGCTLRNTDWVLGLVIYTGNDTKIQLSSLASARTKYSAIDLEINRVMKYFGVFLFTICMVGGIGATLWLYSCAGTAQTNSYCNYLAPHLGSIKLRADGLNFIFKFFGYFLIIAQCIPVSLYVTMKMTRFFQTIFMQWDLKMFHVLTMDNGDEMNIPMRVNNMDLNDEIGQVGFLFSDKTGTLTQNVMDFRKCTISGVSYGLGTTVIGLARLKRMGKTKVVEELRRKMIERSQEKHSKYVDFEDDPDNSLMKALKSTSAQGQKCRSFFLYLALCHSIQIEEKNGKKSLSASSPDEQALVSAAKEFGYNFCGRHSSGAEDIKVVFDAHKNRERKFNILEELEFSSKRKRMSVILEDVETKQIQIISKGADDVIYERLCMRDIKSVNLQKTKTQLLGYANDGLRTLVVGQRVLNRATFKTWHQKFLKVSKNLEEVEKKKKGEPNKIDALCDEMERDLELIGATAIEDKLQNCVPETVELLSSAGIKIWVLTGDKQETAENISFACQLLTEDMVLHTLNGRDPVDPTGLTLKSPDACRQELMAFYDVETGPNADANRPKKALIIDGAALDVIMEDEKLKLALFLVAEQCSAVVACRVSPAHKKQMVSLVTNNVVGIKTLAIGDGANDVPMIQAAHIGIGIQGQEGMQAVNASDYSFGQFQFLSRLLLIHGRHNYRRMASLVCYMFYKNIMLCLVTYWFTLNNGFSGQGFFSEFWGVQVFNVVYTALPILLLTVFDKDVSDDYSLMCPELYFPGIKGDFFAPSVFLRYVGLGIFQSLVITTTCLQTIGSPTGMDSTGHTHGLWMTGAFAFTYLVAITNLQVAFEFNQFHWFSVLWIFLQVFSWPVISAVTSALFQDSHYRLHHRQWELPYYYLDGIFVISVALLPNLLAKGYKIRFQPELVHIVQEVQQGTYKKREYDLNEIRDNVTKTFTGLMRNRLFSRNQNVKNLEDINLPPGHAPNGDLELGGSPTKKATQELELRLQKKKTNRRATDEPAGTKSYPSPDFAKETKALAIGFLKEREAIPKNQILAIRRGSLERSTLSKRNNSSFSADDFTEEQLASKYRDLRRRNKAD